MNPEDKKYVWWGLLGIGVAALFYFLSANKSSSSSGGTTTVPYLVPQYQATTGASPTADTSLSTQPNIVGSSSNSTIPNFSNPYGVTGSPFEAPNTWGFWPNLNVSSPTGPNNSFHRWRYSGWSGNPNSGGVTFPELYNGTGLPQTPAGGAFQAGG